MVNKELDPLRYLASFTLSRSNGDCLKVDGNGNIIQIHKPVVDHKNARVFDGLGLNNTHLEDLETHRLISGKGLVTRYFSNGTFTIYYPSGRIDCSTKSDYYYTIQPDGSKLLVQPSKNESKVVESIPTTSALDPQTGIHFTCRKDNLIILNYGDKSRLVIFPDRTFILTAPGGNRFIIQHEDFDQVDINFDYFRARNPTVIGVSSAFATKGKDNLFERSYTGKLMKVKTKEGLEITTFKEVRELEGYNNMKIVAVTLIKSPDMKIIKLENSGEVVYIDRKDFLSTEDREELISRSLTELQKRVNCIQRGPDYQPEEISQIKNKGFDYFIQLFLPQMERSSGVYTFNLLGGEMKTKDFEGNQFTVNKDGKFRSNIAVSFNLNVQKPMWDKVPDFDSVEHIDPINLDLPVPKSWMPAELVYFTPAGEATVLYTEDMLADYFEDKVNQPSMLIQDTKWDTQTQGMSILTYLDEHKNQECINLFQNTIKTIRESANLENFLLPDQFRELPKTMQLSKEPVRRSYSLRTLIQSKKFEQHEPQLLIDVQQELDRWRESQEIDKERRKVFTQSELETSQELELQQKLLQMAQIGKNIVVYGQSNKSEITYPSNVVFADS